MAADYTRFWWDIRPHPRFGTLEIRMLDQPTALERTSGLVAVLVELCRAVLDQPQREYDPAARGLYHQNRWAAARFGLAAELFHPDGDRTAKRRRSPRSSLARSWTRRRPSRSASSRSDASSGLDAVCADLVERTLG